MDQAFSVKLNGHVLMFSSPQIVMLSWMIFFRLFLSSIWQNIQQNGGSSHRLSRIFRGEFLTECQSFLFFFCHLTQCFLRVPQICPQIYNLFWYFCWIADYSFEGMRHRLVSEEAKATTKYFISWSETSYILCKLDVSLMTWRTYKLFLCCESRKRLHDL